MQLPSGSIVTQVWGKAGAASFGARRETEVHAVIVHYHRVTRSLCLNPEDCTPLCEVGEDGSEPL